MKKTVFPIILFIFCVATYLNANAQSSEAEEKGQKWLDRWVEFESQRLAPNGEAYEPQVFLAEAVREASRKNLTQSKTSAMSNWVPIGPMTKPPGGFHSLLHGMGRINTMAFHPSDSNTFWVGVAQGGVWKTVDGGQSWTPLTDDLPILRISDIAVDPTDPDIIYISVGDYAYMGVGLDLDDRKRHSHYGLGVYKTTDGGLSWNPTGLTFDQVQRNESLIRRVFVNPSNNQELLAGGISGIYRSSDGGQNWSTVNDSLIWDMVSVPGNTNSIYAASGYVKNLDDGSAAILKSVDFGNTWTALNTGIPLTNQVQRIKLAIAPSDTSYVYALSCNMTRGFYGLYRSTDAGSTWVQRSNSPNILTWSSSGSGSNGQGTYDLSIMVDANDKEKIYTGGINMWGSADGGQTWDGASYWTDLYGPSIHADHHYYTYNPLNQTYYACHDGGVSKTKQINIDGWSFVQGGNNWSTNWTDLMDMQITSFYRMGVSANNPGYYIAGAQDNSTYYKTPAGWRNLIGGDGMDCLIHPTNPSTLYGSAQYGYLVRSTDGGVSFSYLSSDMDQAGEQGAWTTPIIMDEANPNTLYTGFGNVWQTIDGGDFWFKLSNFPDMGNQNYPSPIVALANKGSHIYAASRIYHSENEPSKFWASADGGTNWSNRTAGLPDSLFFTSVDAYGSGSTVFVGVGGFQSGAKIYKSIDAGTTWQNISLNLPNVPVNSVKALTVGAMNTIFAGTDVGVYYHNDTMSGWQPYGIGLPNVIVSDLEIDYAQGLLNVATFGRGLWEIDITPLMVGLNDDNLVANFDLKVYPNPVKDQIQFEISEIPSGKIELEIIDMMGRVVWKHELNENGVHSIANELPYGKYFLRIRNNGRSVSRSFISLRD